MAATNLEQPVNSPDAGTTTELKRLAEEMVSQLEGGNVSEAVAVVNQLNEVRDRTLYAEVGRLTRALHEAIKNLNVESIGAGSDIDTASDKLAYVIEMTDKSANRTMDLADDSMPLAIGIQQRADELNARWQQFLNKELKPEEFRQLTKDIQSFLQDSANDSSQLQKQLSEIVLAQDFQDLTGQVIQKVSTLVRDVESRLVNLVVMAGTVDSITGTTHDDLHVEAPKSASDNIAAEGPQIDKTDEGVAATQDDVDDLLSSLGF